MVIVPDFTPYSFLWIKKLSWPVCMFFITVFILPPDAILKSNVALALVLSLLETAK